MKHYEKDTLQALACNTTVIKDATILSMNGFEPEFSGPEATVRLTVPKFASNNFL